MSENNQFNSNEIQNAFINVFDKINGYVDELKKKSSAEILNGSVVNAQKMINEILPFEKVVKKLVEAKSILESIDSGIVLEETDSAEDEEVNEIETREDLHEEDDRFTEPFEFRISLLKSLIYLGGNAAIDEVLEFVKKDMKKKLKNRDFEVINEEGVERWQDSIFQESVRMTEEGLLNNEAKEGYWEIVQKGIDYLSKNGK